MDWLLSQVTPEHLPEGYGAMAPMVTITQLVATVLTLFLTTLGAGWALYIGYRTKAMEQKLEIARLEAEKAKTEARREGRRTRKKVAQLSEKTDGQTVIIGQIEKNTNGQAIRAESEAHKKGVTEGVSLALKEVAASTSSGAIPQPVVVTNTTEQPMPVEIKEHK